jgi:hypothetical protein
MKCSIGAPMHRRDFEEASEARASASNKATSHDEPADRQPLRFRNARIPASDPSGEAECGAVHQQIQKHREDHAGCQPPVNVETRNRAHHRIRIDGLCRRAVRVGRIPENPLDEEVDDGDRDIGQQ